MSQSLPDYLPSIATLLSVIVAVVALGVAIYFQIQSNKQFKTNMGLQSKIAAGNIKPLLSISESPKTIIFSEALIAVVLNNDGLGPAVIKKVIFTKGTISGKSIPRILNVPTRPRGYEWDAYKEFPETGIYLRAGESIILLKLTLEGLKNQGFYGISAQQIMANVRSEIRQVKISIEFENILEEKQPIFEVTLH